MGGANTASIHLVQWNWPSSIKVIIHISMMKTGQKLSKVGRWDIYHIALKFRGSKLSRIAVFENFIEIFS